MTEQEIRDIAQKAMREVMSAKNTDDRMGALEERVEQIGNALNEISAKLSGKNAAFDGEETAEEEKAEKKEEEKDGATLENAKPSQALIATVATALNIDFGAKTPSFKSIAPLLGITETDPALRIAAVNTKVAELQKNAPNDKTAATSLSEVF